MILIIDIPALFTMLFSFRLQKVSYVGRIIKCPSFQRPVFVNKSEVNNTAIQHKDLNIRHKEYSELLFVDDA